MKKWKFAALVMAAAVAASSLAGCGGDKGSSQQSAGANADLVAKTGFPIVEEPITITIFCSKPSACPNDFNEIPFYARYEEETNVHVEWQAIDDVSFDEKLGVIIATEDLPDVIMKGYIADTEVSKQVKYGTYQDLSGMLADYAPNLNAILDENPGVRSAITIEGAIYGLPYICLSDSTRTRKQYINTKWLDAVGKEMPTNLDELIDVLRAFRDGDPNGNGEADEIPLARESIGGIKTDFFGCFGLMNRGLPNGSYYIDEDPDNAGQVRFFRAADGMKDLLAFIKQLYEEKLIDPNIFSITSAEVYAYGAQNRIGMHGILPSLIGPAYCDDFVGLDAPLAGYDGTISWPSVLGKTFTKNCFLITKANQYPEATLRWVDYFYSEQGSIDFFLGEEGVSYEKTADGTYEYTDLIINNPDGLSQDDAIGKYSIYAGGANPTVITDENFKGSEMYPSSVAATPNFLEYGPDPLWEEFVFTPEEGEQLSMLRTDLESMMTENEAKFITGERSLDEWDAYVKELESAGMSEYVKLYQTAYERYSESVK